MWLVAGRECSGQRAKPPDQSLPGVFEEQWTGQYD